MKIAHTTVAHVTALWESLVGEATDPCQCAGKPDTAATAGGKADMHVPTQTNAERKPPETQVPNSISAMKKKPKVMASSS